MEMKEKKRIEQQLIAQANRIMEEESDVEIIANTLSACQALLTIIKNRIQKVREKMGNLQNATIDELTTYEQKINSLIEELALVENASHINVAMSLSRFQTAVKIGEILGDEFEMIDSDGDFYCEENREEYHAVYVNPATGDKVVVVITPVSDEAGVVSNHIELIAGNSMDNDIVNRGTIHNVVSAKLREGGIQDMHLERCAGRHGDQLQRIYLFRPVRMRKIIG